MHTVRIYRLDHLSPTLFQRLKAAQMEAAQVWNYCCELHKEARQTGRRWPGQSELQKATKGRYALHSQSVQMVAQAFLTNIETTQKLRATHPKMRMRYPWKTKQFELHVCIEIPQAVQAPGKVRAAVDLGEIHLAAVTTNSGAAIVVSGRGIRSLKRQRNMRHRQLAKRQARCQKYSRRWNKSKQARIESFTGSERGTSSQCPVCRHKHKPKGRVWKCRKCGFQGHRDVVGSVNMHRLTYGEQVTFPRSVTYLRPGLSRRSSRAGTPHAS